LLKYSIATLKSFRALDDNIIPKLNALTTRSPNLLASCARLFDEIVDSFVKRETILDVCSRKCKDDLETALKNGANSAQVNSYEMKVNSILIFMAVNERK